MWGLAKWPRGQQISQTLKRTKREAIKEYDSRTGREKRKENKNKKTQELQQTKPYKSARIELQQTVAQASN